MVLIEYPRPGIYSVGIITSEQEDEISLKLNRKTVCVFIPTTPIPTSGFLVIIPLDQVTKLDMSVAEWIQNTSSAWARFRRRTRCPV